MNEENNSSDSQFGIPIIDNTKAEINLDNPEKIIEQRTKNVLRILKKPSIWVLGFLIIAIILGVYIRSMPMQDHNPNIPGNQPGLWDITTDTWTLGPDLDPWLFTRVAKVILESGGLPEIDTMRYAPIGKVFRRDTILLPYMIAFTHKFFNLFGEYPVEFSAAIFPVIMFVLTIISFFLFVREIFIRKSKKSKIRANVISLISTFFMVVIPVFISRTIAGIPEKESAAFFFMFLTFYLFLKSWKSKNIKKAILFGILSAISTIIMAAIWGGYTYLFVVIATATFTSFILNKVKKKELIVYGSWFLTSIIFIPLMTRTSFRTLITSLSTGLSFLVFLILLVHFILWKTNIYKKIKFLEKINFPKNILSIIITLILVIILGFIFFGSNFILDKIKTLHQTIFKPITGRWITSVAENRQPFFVEWSRNFGPYLGNFPIMFWLFFTGSIVLFKKMFNKIKTKDSWKLTLFYVFFLSGLIFSRYSSSSIFNGENFISKSFYYLSAFLFVGFLIYYYIKYHQKKDDSFEKISFEYLFLFILFILALFTARSAIRFVMVLGPITSIFVGFLIIESLKEFRKSRDEIGKMVLGILLILIILTSLFTFWTFYNTSKVQAYNMIPSHYNQQWQKAMNWVRTETPKSSVFGHWWDYGYWLQSIGERTTVLDGGNSIVYWNYLMGRVVLTGSSQDEALEFLYNHNTTHFLIDSTDIGKYGAYSSIGSDENYDRYSWFGTFLLDEKQTQETKNQTLLIYPGGMALDEDLIINHEGKEILLPKGSSGVGAIILPTNEENNEISFDQPSIILFYNGNQYKQDLRYLSLGGGQFIDFNSGIEAATHIFPRIGQSNQGLTQNSLGAAIFLSPRLMRGMMTQKYILDDPFNNFPNFKLVHTEPSLIIDQLNKQGMNLPNLIYYQGIQGPIKIWEIEYTGKEEIKEKYSDLDASKYLDWKL